MPTTADTSWGSYDFTIDAISGDIAKQIQVSVTINPQGLNDFSYDNTNSVDIPDNDDAGITSVITINDDITIFGSSTYLDITHTYIGDLVATLTSPSGTTATLHNKSGGGTDDIKQSFASDAFNGEVARGDWVLNVVDTLDDDTGTLNQWSLTLTGLGEVSPSAPEANFSYVAELLSVNFTDQSTDVNNDIASWAWDFGDTNSSSEQNPTHNYAAAGTYQVSLTVTDEEGLTDTHTFDVTVADANIELSVKRATKTRRNYARIELAYSGAVTQTVDVYRDGVKIDNASSTGIYRDFIRRATQSQYVYKVCSSDTICSEEVTVTFE